MDWAIETHQVTRRFKSAIGKRWWRRKKNGENGYGEVIALDGVDLTVKPGELFGLLGPNGAGKTTLIKILSTLLLPSTGTAMVDGIDVAKKPEQVRKRINMVSGGEHSGYGILTVRETIWMFAQFYGVSTKLAHERADRMMEALDLTRRQHEDVEAVDRNTTEDEHHARICDRSEDPLPR
jgi:ABC-2 type transport system ATP-binding protein